MDKQYLFALFCFIFLQHDCHLVVQFVLEVTLNRLGYSTVNIIKDVYIYTLPKFIVQWPLKSSLFTDFRWVYCIFINLIICKWMQVRNSKNVCQSLQKWNSWHSSWNKPWILFFFFFSLVTLPGTKPRNMSSDMQTKYRNIIGNESTSLKSWYFWQLHWSSFLKVSLWLKTFGSSNSGSVVVE